MVVPPLHHTSHVIVIAMVVPPLQRTVVSISREAEENIGQILKDVRRDSATGSTGMEETSVSSLKIETEVCENLLSIQHPIPQEVCENLLSVQYPIPQEVCENLLSVQYPIPQEVNENLLSVQYPIPQLSGF